MSHFFDNLMIAKWEFQNRRDKVVIISVFGGDSIFCRSEGKIVVWCQDFHKCKSWHIFAARFFSNNQTTNYYERRKNDSKKNGQHK